MSKSFLIAVFGLALSSAAAPASTLLDTITGPFNPNGGLVIASGGLPTPTGSESDAVSFSVAGAQSISSIEAFIASPSGSGSVNLGIMASVGGLPSGTFLDVATASLVPGSPVTINSLNWSLASGSYWLVATTGGFDFWNQGSDVSPFATSTSATGDAGSWSLGGGGAPEALIIGVATTPLPASWGMMLLGLVVIGYLAIRRPSGAYYAPGG
jgi:hypothetical protein